MDRYHGNKPAYMDDMVAHKKKKEVVSDARIFLKIAKARATELRAKLAAEKIARAAKESAQRVRIAADKALTCGAGRNRECCSNVSSR